VRTEVLRNSVVDMYHQLAVEYYNCWQTPSSVGSLDVQWANSVFKHEEIPKTYKSKRTHPCTQELMDLRDRYNNMYQCLAFPLMYTDFVYRTNTDKAMPTTNTVELLGKIFAASVSSVNYHLWKKTQDGGKKSFPGNGYHQYLQTGTYGGIYISTLQYALLVQLMNEQTGVTAFDPRKCRIGTIATPPKKDPLPTTDHEQMLRTVQDTTPDGASTRQVWSMDGVS